MQSTHEHSQYMQGLLYIPCTVHCGVTSCELHVRHARQLVLRLCTQTRAAPTTQAA
jgi:hypothetical protein